MTAHRGSFIDDRRRNPSVLSTRNLITTSRFCFTILLHRTDPGNLVEIIFKDVLQSEERELPFMG